MYVGIPDRISKLVSTIINTYEKMWGVTPDISAMLEAVPFL